MYHVSAQGVDERMINVHYYYYYVHQVSDWVEITANHLIQSPHRYILPWLPIRQREAALVLREFQ